MATEFSNFVAGYWIDETQSFTTGGNNFSITKDGTGVYHMDYSEAEFDGVPIVLVTGEDPDNDDGIKAATTENHSSTACTVVLKSTGGNKKDANLNVLIFLP